MEKIVLFGGTFNPITQEHINIIKTLASKKDVLKVIVVPTYLPPHKKSYQIYFQHRVNMLNIALNGIKKVEVSLFEIEQKRAVYSWETVTYFKNLYPNNQLCFAMGTDMLYTFNQWKNPSIIVSLADIILFRRASSDKTLKAIASFEKTYNKKVIIEDYVSQDISSTEIRVKKMLNLPLLGLTDEKVIKYIYSNNLYVGDRFYNYVCQVLPQKRRNHTAGVILCALELAKTLNLDQRQAEIGALLHDNAKYLNPTNYKNFKCEKVPSSVVHQFLGAYIAKEQLCILDEEIITAIKYHTTGRANMTLLEKVIFMADIIEVSRTFSGVERLRELTYKNFDIGFTESVKDLYNSLEQDRYFLTEECYKYYVKE